jgi:hypothetical protein
MRRAIAPFLLLLCSVPAAAQTPSTIPEMWNAWCARCHGQDGSGKVATPTISVEPMDFTACRIATAEPDADWEVAIAEGGPAVGLSSEMPAFGDALTAEQIQGFVQLIRGFCKERGWPIGNMNLPRPMFTEKAFPENEVVFAPMISHRTDEPVEVAFATIFERRFGRRAQLEAVFPIESVSSGARETGVGDIELGLKYALTPSHWPALVSGGFDVKFPTGSESRGLGGGVTVFEPYAAFATVARDLYLQGQLKFEFPSTNTWDDRETIYNLYIGRDTSIYPNTWTIGLELNGENDEVALTPQIRKGLTKTGALAAAFGVRLPLNHRDEQGIKWVGYLLWEYLEPVFSAR